MPDPASSLTLLAIAFAAASGLPSLAMRRGSRKGQVVATSGMLLAAVLGIAGALLALLQPGSIRALPALPWPAGNLPGMRIDPLSAFFLVPVFLVGGMSALYGSSYRPAVRNPRTARRMSVFLGTLVAGMAVLVVSSDAFSFILGWEAMALSAFFLIGIDDESAEARSAGLVYLLATHAGTLVLFALFALWRTVTGSFAFDAAAGAALGPATRGALFLLALLVFSLKAGAMPLHFWLPGAHAAAPSHVSALLSGVVLKMGIYGLMRFTFMLGEPAPSWGWAVLAIGAASSVLGVAFAMGQHDLKRLLAYHSVENIGIILMGFGLGLIGVSSGRGLVAVLGMGAALLHVWNHAIFKSLLFLGAGSVVSRTGTRSPDRLGGLAASMPWTAGFFLVGSIAIAGLPPLNGFMSEFLLYLAAFVGSRYPGAVDSGPLLVAAALATTGALALACFVKVYGAIFLGAPRTTQRPGLRESPPSMLVPMGILAMLCIAIGVLPGIWAPLLDRVIRSLPLGTGVDRSGLMSLAPVSALAFGGLVFAAVVTLAFLGLSFLVGRRARRGQGTWDCGYAKPGPRMQYGASSFAASIVGLFSWALRPRFHIPRIEGSFPGATGMHSHVDDASLDRMVIPFMRKAESRIQWFRRFQQGQTQMYVLYVLVTLLALLCTLVPFGDMLADLVAGR